MRDELERISDDLENNPWIQVPPAVRTIRAIFSKPIRVSFPWVSLRRNEPDVIYLEGHYNSRFHYGLRGIFHSRAWESQKEAEKMWRSQRCRLKNMMQLGYYHGGICVPQVYNKEFQDVSLHDLFFFSVFNGLYYADTYPSHSLEGALFDVKNPQRILEYDWCTGS